MKNRRANVPRILLTLLACLFGAAAVFIVLRVTGRSGDRTPLLWLLLLLPVLLGSLIALFAGGRRRDAKGRRMRAAIVTVSLLLLLTTLTLSAGIVYRAAVEGDISVPVPAPEGWLMMWNRVKPPVFVPRSPSEAQTGNDGPGGDPEDDTRGEPQRSDEPLLSGDGRIGSPMDSSVGGAGEEIPVFVIGTDTDGVVYLQYKSFGDYDGQSWQDIMDYPADSYTGGSRKFTPRSLTAERLTGTGTPKHALMLERLQGDFAVPYFYLDANNECTVNDTVVTAGDESLYLFTYCVVDPEDYPQALTAAAQLPIFIMEAYDNWAHDNYCRIDDESRLFFKAVINENGLTVPQEASAEEKLAVISRAAEWVQNAAEYNLYYDRALDGEKNIALSFLTEYREGICSHFATAGTLLFRAMGLPARYTIGYVANAQALTPCTVTTNDAHAWVEVYLDGLGWIPVEVTGRTQGGTGLNDPLPSGMGEPEDNEGRQPGYDWVNPLLRLTPKLTEYRYDGKVKQPLQELAGFDELAQKGFTYRCVIEGEASEPGYTPTAIRSLTIFDPYGNDVTDKLHPDLGTGLLHIYLTDFVACSPDVTMEYEGGSVIISADDCEVQEADLPEGLQAVITMQPLSGEVGTRPVLFGVRILDADGKDCTDLYRVIRKCGTLTVTARLLRLKAADASKTYDGTPLVCPDYTVTFGSLREGDVLDACSVTGSQTAIGRSANVVDLSHVRILNAQGEDVTHCYRIEAENGTLRVTP